MLLLCFSLGLGVVVEYKLGWLDAFQTFRHRPYVLPEMPVNFNARSGQNLQHIISLPQTVQDRKLWRSSVRERIYSQIQGSLFPPGPVQYRLDKTVTSNGVIEKWLTVSGFDGQLVPARLFLPAKVTIPAPAVLLVSGHVPQGESGLLQLSEGVNSYQHAAARQLAEAGFVTLAFELRGFGYLGEPEFPEHRAVAYNALQRGESYKSLILKDTASAMSLLRQLPQVDPSRTAIAGASYGGEIAVQFAALDEKVAAVSFHSYGGGQGKVRALSAGVQLPHFCHLFPMVDDWMAQEHWLWLLAPRAVQGVRGFSNQHNFIDRHDLYSRAWENRADLTLQVEEGSHELFVEQAITFFKSKL